MTTREDIAGLLAQWLQLTLAETEAIRNAAWAELKRLQATKAELQPPLNEATAEWQAEHARLTNTAPSDHPFRAEVNRLIALEAGNGKLLAEQMAKNRQAFHSLGASRRNLRRVHSSYARPRTLAWQSYS